MEVPLIVFDHIEKSVKVLYGAAALEYLTRPGPSMENTGTRVPVAVTWIRKPGA
jgi:hypothetical protein